MTECCKINHVNLDLNFVKIILERLYVVTNTTDVVVMLSKISTIQDDDVRESLYCLKKLIQLNSSGYIDPPIDFNLISFPKTHSILTTITK